MTVFRKSVGGFGIGTGSFDSPVDVTQDENGNFYVLDAGNNRVQKFDSFMNFKLSWGSFGARTGEFNRPTAIAMSPGGYLYVVDTGNHRVQQFTRDGDFVGSWGSLGSRPGNFKNPRDIAFKSEGTTIFQSNEATTFFWVLDSGNDRIQEFKFSGDSEKSGSGPTFVSEFGSTFMRDPAVYSGMVSLAWSSERFGYLYVIGDGCLVQQFQTDGSLIKTWTATVPESGLCEPGRIEIDNKNDFVYVLDSGNSVLGRFNLDGQILFSMRGADRSFAHPLGFAVNPHRDEILVADTQNNIVQKFTLR